jgi:hypothetical protein
MLFAHESLQIHFHDGTPDSNRNRLNRNFPLFLRNIKHYTYYQAFYFQLKK